LRRERWQKRRRIVAFCLERERRWRQFLCSFGSSRSSVKVLGWESAKSSSLKMGSETTYFSEAHAPRSATRQRSLQNGKSASCSESVGFLQVGHLCFIAKMPDAGQSTRPEESSLPQLGNERMPCSGRPLRRRFLLRQLMVVCPCTCLTSRSCPRAFPHKNIRLAGAEAHRPAVFADSVVVLWLAIVAVARRG